MTPSPIILNQRTGAPPDERSALLEAAVEFVGETSKRIAAEVRSGAGTGSGGFSELKEIQITDLANGLLKGSLVYPVLGRGSLQEEYDLKMQGALETYLAMHSAPASKTRPESGTVEEALPVADKDLPRLDETADLIRKSPEPVKEELAKPPPVVEEEPAKPPPAAKKEPAPRPKPKLSEKPKQLPVVKKEPAPKTPVRPGEADLDLATRLSEVMKQPATAVWFRPTHTFYYDKIYEDFMNKINKVSSKTLSSPLNFGADDININCASDFIRAIENGDRRNMDIFIFSDMVDFSSSTKEISLTPDQLERLADLAKKNLVRFHVLYWKTRGSQEASRNEAQYRKLCASTGGSFGTVSLPLDMGENELNSLFNEEAGFILNNLLLRQSVLMDMISNTSAPALEKLYLLGSLADEGSFQSRANPASPARKLIQAVNSQASQLTDKIVISSDSYLAKLAKLGKLHANIDFSRLTNGEVQKLVLGHIRSVIFEQTQAYLNSAYSRSDAASAIAALWSADAFFGSVRAIALSNLPWGEKANLMDAIRSNIPPSDLQKGNKSEILRRAKAGELGNNP